MRALSLNLLLVLSCMSSAVAAERLNVLFVVADDLRDYGGVFNRQLVKTPNLDRLRARGVTFERAYVQYPVCNPSRTSFLTGLRCEQTGVVDNTARFRTKLPDIVTLPQLCKEAGWETHAFGKLFHLSGRDEPSRQDWMDAGRSWHSASAFEATKAGRRLIEERNVTGSALKWCQWGMAEGTDDDQPDGQIAAATVAMIQKLGDQPWFIGCGFMKPHDPFIAPKKYFDLYPLESLPLWHDPQDTTPAPAQAVGFGEYGKAFGQFTDTATPAEQVQMLFVRNEGAIRAFVRALQPSLADADDVLQETFLTVSRKASSFEPGTNFVAWACGIARLKVLENFRQKKRTNVLSEAAISALADELPTSDLTGLREEALSRCVEKLAPKSRELLWRRYSSRQDSDEMADGLGMTSTAVRVALSKARAFLRDCVSVELKKA